MLQKDDSVKAIYESQPGAIESKSYFKQKRLAENLKGIIQKVNWSK